MQRSELVSSGSERLILVDSEDQEIGTLPKADCHEGEGILHRAFSVFIFNDSGDVLLQKRSQEKPLWPGYWSNACCSHPRHGESVNVALRRRLQEELGIDCALEFLYKFEYQAPYEDIGSEHEICSVFVGRHDGPFDPNVKEIAELRFITPAELDVELDASPENFTPWFKIEWSRIRASSDIVPAAVGTAGG